MRRVKTFVAAVACIVLAVVVVGASQEQDLPGITATIFNGNNLRGWKSERALAKVMNSGELRLEESAGWLRTEQAYSDYVLRLKVRMLDPDAQAGVFVRAYRSPETNRPTPWMGYEIIARDNPSEVRIAPRQLDAKPTTFDPGPDVKLLSSDEWHSYEIDCRGPRVTVRVDGRIADALDDVRNPSGYIGLKVRKGKAEFRYIDVQQPAIPGVPFAAKVYAPGDAGVVAPVAVERAEANYSEGARMRSIEGMVRVEGAVAPDGTVHNVVVVLPLDPQFGLDAAAMEAFKHWRFTPGSKDGQYVPVRVQAEFAFKLR
jgi:TonB family protein